MRASGVSERSEAFSWQADDGAPLRWGLRQWEHRPCKTNYT